MLAQEISQLPTLADEITLTEAERQMTASWMLPTSVGAFGTLDCQGRADVIQGLLSRTERDLFFTNERMTI
jgi:hypothetical protein